jgi:hypothetical protein
MATDWYIEGVWVKSCNCDPGCPCDFNQRPTRGYCEGMAAMRIDKGHFGEVELEGVKFAALVHWPGPMHEGKGEVQPILDSRATAEQRGAVLEIMSGRHGDSLFEVMAYICPTVHKPIVAPIDLEADLDSRDARLRIGDVLEADVETLRGIEPPDPYRIVVRIPGGMEYTGPNEEAETALAKRIRAKGAIQFEVANGHSSLAFVRHGSGFRSDRYRPTVVEKAF